MESPPSCLPSSASSAAHDNGSEVAAVQKDKDDGPLSQVDPFLVEALQNHRHRLNVLRMELDIQRFMRSTGQHQFEFQHFPTSYLRAAAHRVAQHYGLQTMVLDVMLDGSGRIVVRKTPESRFPSVCLSGIPPKQPENDKLEQIKIVLRPKHNKSSQNDAEDQESKRSLVRTVEERKEDYDRARARIFNIHSSSELEGLPSQVVADGRGLCSTREEIEDQRNSSEESDKYYAKDGASRVAIFRDREKDRTDPDYDRGYGRFLKSTSPNHNFSPSSYNVLPPPFMQYELGFHQLGQFPRAQTSVGYRHSDHVFSPSSYSSVGCNQNSRDAVYMQWPSPAMIYAQSYEHIRHAPFQVPFYQQPLSLDNSQNR